MDLSEGENEEKPQGTCKHADNYRSDSNKNGKAADGFGIEGRCKACSADTFGNKADDAKGCEGCNADRFDGRGKNNKNGRSSDSFNPSKKSGRDADKYDAGKGSKSDTRKHVDKYESTNEGGCRGGSLAELDDCTDEQKGDPNSKCFVSEDMDDNDSIVQSLSQVEKKVKTDAVGKYIDEDESKFEKKETKIKAKLDEIDALSNAASSIEKESKNCKACKKCKQEKKVVGETVEAEEESEEEAVSEATEKAEKILEKAKEAVSSTSSSEESTKTTSTTTEIVKASEKVK
jgi:hypothetical protein